MVDGVRGLGDLALAVILGETGDLSRYSNPGKVWKRLGLAPLDGKAMSTGRSKGGLSAEDWVSPLRDQLQSRDYVLEVDG